MTEACLLLAIIGMFVLGLVAIVYNKKVQWWVGPTGAEVDIAPDRQADPDEINRKEKKPRKRAG